MSNTNDSSIINQEYFHELKFKILISNTVLENR